MPRIHHVSSIEHVSFNPDLVMPRNMFQIHPDQYAGNYHSSLSDDSDTSEDVPPTPRATPAGTQVCLEEDEEEEVFQMVPSDDEHWTTREVPDRILCIHEHALPYGECP